MENRIPIDELFHDKLSRGREQMNLGAWANMERMLDGKNPYIQEDEKKKRRILPFLFLLLIASGIVGAGYWLRTGHSEKDASENTSANVLNHPQLNVVSSDKNSETTPAQPATTSNLNSLHPI